MNICSFCFSKNLKLIWIGYPRAGNLNNFSTNLSKVFRCIKCKSIKLNHSEKYDDTNFISGNYRNSVSDKHQYKEIFTEKVVFLNEISNYTYNKYILDFGCGHGHLLKLLANFNKKLVGLELDKNFHFKNNNILVTNNFNNSDKFVKKFDVIFIFSTLIMIEEPIKLIKEFKKRLNKNGIIIVGDINAEDMLVDYGKKKYEKIFYRLSCKNYPSKKGLKLLFEKANFKLINHKYIERYDYKNFRQYLDLNKISYQKEELSKEKFIETKIKNRGTDYLITIFKKQ